MGRYEDLGNGEYDYVEDFWESEEWQMYLNEADDYRDEGDDLHSEWEAEQYEMEY